MLKDFSKTALHSILAISSIALLMGETACDGGDVKTSTSSSSSASSNSSSNSSSSTGSAGAGGMGGEGGSGGAGGSGGSGACPISKDLFGQWRGESNANDSSGVANGVWSGTEQYTKGRIGKAFLFDGASAVVAPVNFTGPMTVSLWVRSTDPVPQLFASAMSSANTTAAPYFQIDSNGSSKWRYLAAGGTADFGALDNMSFRHLAMTFDGTKITTYYDGKAVGSIDNTDAAFKEMRLAVNRMSDVGLKGAVDEVYIWKRALSAAEIAQLHDSPQADLCAAPVCGDGVVDNGESCDDGNTISNDGCTPDCKNECSALDFNNTGYGVAALPIPLSVKSVTLAGWYKAPVGATFAYLAAKMGNVFGGRATYGLNLGPGGLGARLQTDVNAIFLDLNYATAIPDGKWHHSAVTYDEATGNGVLYFDGASVATGTQGTGLVAGDASRPFVIGAAEHNGNYEFGVKAGMADFVVYDKPLTAAEVAGLAQNKYPALAPLARYKTLERMGMTSADSSGNGHNLTLTNGGWVNEGPFCTP